MVLLTKARVQRKRWLEEKNGEFNFKAGLVLHAPETVTTCVSGAPETD